MQQPVRQKDTSAWIIQVWLFFVVSILAMLLSILRLPTDRTIDSWMKGQLGISFFFSISSSFTLAKTIRDNHEASRLTARIDEARVEKILSEHHPLKD
ncbi:MAG: YiaA/YiaB family inner membrane protein [Leptolyngbyaceae cyanobacterium]